MPGEIQAELRIVNATSAGAGGAAPGGLDDPDIKQGFREMAKHFRRPQNVFGGGVIGGAGKITSLLGVGAYALFGGEQANKEIHNFLEELLKSWLEGIFKDPGLESVKYNRWVEEQRQRAANIAMMNPYNAMSSAAYYQQMVKYADANKPGFFSSLFGGASDFFSGLFGGAQSSTDEVLEILSDGKTTTEEIVRLQEMRKELSKDTNRLTDEEFQLLSIITHVISKHEQSRMNTLVLTQEQNEALRQQLKLLGDINAAENRMNRDSRARSVRSSVAGDPNTLSNGMSARDFILQNKSMFTADFIIHAANKGVI